MINNNLNGKVMKNVKMFVLLALSLCITLFATSCSEDETSQVSFTWQVVDLGISSSFPSKTSIFHTHINKKF